MVNRETELAIGDELQTIFHSIANATKQAAEETRKELAPMKITLTDNNELHETNVTGESIKSYEYDECQLNCAEHTTITIENQDQSIHLHNSYLLVKGDALKVDNARYADADHITLTNNGLLYIFSSLKVKLAGQTVEHVNYFCQATSLLGLASYSSTYYKGCGLTQGWFPNINTNAAVNNTGFYTQLGYPIRNPNPKGSGQCAIPMRHIFGFMRCEIRCN